MKTSVIIGIILIVLGIVAFAYQGISYTRNETVVDLGDLKVQAKKRETAPLPPILGGVAVVCGVVLVILGSRRNV